MAKFLTENWNIKKQGGDYVPSLVAPVGNSLQGHDSPLTKSIDKKLNSKPLLNHWFFKTVQLDSPSLLHQKDLKKFSSFGLFIGCFLSGWLLGTFLFGKGLMAEVAPNPNPIQTPQVQNISPTPQAVPLKNPASTTGTAPVANNPIKTLNGINGAGNPQALSYGQQVVGSAGELIDVGELLGINVMTKGPAEGPAYITLNDTIEALLKNNKKMQADLMVLMSARIAIDKAEVEYMPEVVLNGTLGRTQVKPEDSDTENNLVGGKWNGYNTNRQEIVLRQKLYDFGYRDEAIKAAKADYSKQEASFKALMEDKIMEVVRLYAELRKSIFQYRLLNDYYAQGLELFKVIKDRTDNDLAPQSELEYVQLQLAEARQQLTQSASIITQGKRAFEQEVGIWPQQLAGMPLVAVEKISQLTDVNMPSRNSSSVQEILAEVDKRQAELNLINAKDKPSVNMEVTGYRQNNSGNNQNTDYGVNGVLTTSWTLYDGGRNDLAYKQALAQLKQSKYAVDYLSEKAKGDSLRRLIEVKQADREIEIVKSMMASSDQIIKHNTRLFQAGLVSATFMIG